MTVSCTDFETKEAVTDKTQENLVKIIDELNIQIAELKTQLEKREENE